MAWALKLRVLVLAYVLIPVLFHPLLSQGVMASPADSTKAKRIDGKAIDQGIAYVLMLVALLVTYLVH
ncbi:hypothetical protein OPV22_006918 [Ensete ventricosum]|uniref:Arabinogalactan peptide 22 n=1 Tax=Ensete ventricosum TaxID=4639 RepID=A0AAV8QCX7_ENSVE|nr:hypothetical protein OPV22_006918 [Ensete ventricosum]